MPKIKDTPGIVLNALIKKHGLNYNRLANAIGISSAMVRLIARDENPISASVAYRLAKFFKTKPEYWMVLQLEYDVAKASGNKKLDKELMKIPTVDKAVFIRKKRTTKVKTKTKTTKAKTSGTARRGRPPAGSKKKTVKVKTSGTARRGRPPASAKAKKAAPAKKTVVKTAAKKNVKPAGKRPAVKRSAVKPPAVKKPAPKKKVSPVVKKTPQPKVVIPALPPTVTLVDTTINEPQI